MSDAIRVSLAPAAVKIVRDGDPIEVVITIQNAGTTVDQYAVELDGLPTTWYSLSNSSVALFPQDTDEAKLVVRPPKGAGVRAGTYPFVVTVLSRADTTQTTRVEGTLEVGAVAAFELDMSPRKVIGRAGQYRLTMRNGGNADLEVKLEASDAEAIGRYTFTPPTVRVAAEQQATVSVTLQPRRSGFVGQKKQVDFQVKATPTQGEAKTIQGQLVHTPRLRTWKPIRRLVLLLAVIALLLVAFNMVGGAEGVRKKGPQWQKVTAQRPQRGQGDDR